MNTVKTVKTYKKEIIYNNQLYIITSDPYESYEIFCERVNFVINNIAKFGNIDSAIMESKIERNIKLYGAIY